MKIEEGLAQCNPKKRNGRRKMKVKASRAAVVALVLAMALVPLRSEAKPGMEPRSSGTLMRCMKRLNLTESQRLRVKEIIDAQRAKRVKLLEELVKAREHLRDTMNDDNATDAEVTSAWNKVASIKGKMLLLRRKTRREIMAVLTPDQRVRLKEMILMRRLNDGGGRQRMGRPLRLYDGV